MQSEVDLKSPDLNVRIVDSNIEQLQKSKLFAESWAKKEVEKQRMTSEQQYAFLERISYFNCLSYLSKSDFVIEAVVENLEAKS